MGLTTVSSPSISQADTARLKAPTLNHIVSLTGVTPKLPDKQRHIYQARHSRDLEVTFWEHRMEATLLFGQG